MKKLSLAFLLSLICNYTFACEEGVKRAVDSLLNNLCSQTSSKVIRKVRTSVQVAKNCSTDAKVYTAEKLVSGLRSCHTSSAVIGTARSMIDLCDRDMQCAEAVMMSFARGNSCGHTSSAMIGIINGIKGTVARNPFNSVKNEAAIALANILSSSCHTSSVVYAAEQALIDISLCE
ncbi:MAG: hypothetical protein CME62_07985 [Halobacteriovoraceae bacterium]|nr:hypothetical protein [Halobacteriovoraceae bacterium]|tara:strand:- start:6071 stop:6598 length:528 start_codon:yes stop_codon:yes gene_type:complete